MQHNNNQGHMSTRTRPVPPTAIPRPDNLRAARRATATAAENAVQGRPLDGPTHRDLFSITDDEKLRERKRGFVAWQSAYASQ
jgi:hypothetical protein